MVVNQFKETLQFADYKDADVFIGTPSSMTNSVMFFRANSKSVLFLKELCDRLDSDKSLKFDNVFHDLVTKIMAADITGSKTLKIHGYHDLDSEYLQRKARSGIVLLGEIGHYLGIKGRSESVVISKLDPNVFATMGSILSKETKVITVEGSDIESFHRELGTWKLSLSSMCIQP